jgi:surface protein
MSALTLTLTTTTDYRSVNIPLNGVGLTVTVDWGDNNTDNTLSHNYLNNGTYNVSLNVNSGTELRLNGWSNHTVTAVTSFGNLNLVSLCFADCFNLTSVPSSIPTTVTNLATAFQSTSINDVNITNWNTSNITDMNSMFYNARKFNQNIGNWDTSNVTNMSAMFYQASIFNQNIGGWDTSNVTDMNSMFFKATAFNKNIGNWNTSKVTNMRIMFQQASNFNEDISTKTVNGTVRWNTSNVTDMNSMFREASLFNQNIGNWDTSKVTYMTNMFFSARNFTQNIGNWNTSKVTNMNSMFREASLFNQNIGNWDTSKVTDMSYMFRQASLFNQNIGGWNVTQVTGMTEFLLSNSAMSIPNFDSLLIGWASQNVKSGVTLTASSLKYSVAGQSAYNTLISKGWTISSAGIDPTYVVPPIITFSPIIKNYGDDAFIPSPSSTSSGAFTYTSSNTNVATGGSIITIVGPGTTTITATQAANGGYSQGTSSTILTVNTVNPYITFSPITKSSDDVAFIPSPSSTSSGAFTYTSSNTNVATGGSIITIVGPGTTTITATQAANGGYLQGTATTTLTVNIVNAPPAINIIKNINNSVLTYTNSMPMKDSTSDGTSTFSIGRMMHVNNVSQNSHPHKKWIGGNRDASQIIKNQSISAIGNGTMNATNVQNSFVSNTSKNVVKSALSRVRGTR